MCSETYATLIPAIFGILVTCGVFTPEKASELQRNLMPLIGLILTAVGSSVYAQQRTQLKQSVVQAITSTPVADSMTMLLKRSGV